MLKHRQHHVLLFDCSFCHAHTTNYMKFYLVVYFQRFRWISYQDFFSAFCKCNSNKSYKMTHRIWVMFYESYNKSRSFRKHSHDIWNDKNFLILFRSQNRLFRRQWRPSFRTRLLWRRIRTPGRLGRRIHVEAWFGLFGGRSVRSKCSACSALIENKKDWPKSNCNFEIILNHLETFLLSLLLVLVFKMMP